MAARERRKVAVEPLVEAGVDQSLVDSKKRAAEEILFEESAKYSPLSLKLDK